MIDSRSEAQVGEHGRAEDPVKAIQAERRQRRQTEQHPHRPGQDHEAGGEAVALRTRQLQHRGGQRRDDHTEAKPA